MREMLSCKECRYGEVNKSKHFGSYVLCNKVQRAVLPDGYCYEGKPITKCSECENFDVFKQEEKAIQEERRLVEGMGERGKRAQVLSAAAFVISVISFGVTIARFFI